MSKFNRLALRISRKLARLHSMWYALIYILLIPGFALLYHFCLSKDFYHSTAQYEQEFRDYKEGILQTLTEEIKTTFKQVHRSNEMPFKGYVINADSFEPVPESLTIDKEKIIFRLDLEITKVDDQVRVKTAPTVELPLLEWSDEQESDGRTVEYRSVVIKTLLEAPNSSETSSQLRLSKILFPSLPKRNTLNLLFDNQNEKNVAEKTYLPISRQLNEKIISLANGTEGFPSSMTGGFPRMLYLSSVTITTLGYGDILPITTASRIFVSLEAVLGIILIGLFLNAISHEVSERSEK